MSLLTAFMAVAVTMGLLAAGLLIPPVAGIGQLAKGGAQLYDDLPTAFTSVVPQQQSQLLAANGKTVIATLYDENRIVVPEKAISPWMRKAQVAIEDHRFYEHGGVDLEGIGSAVAGVAVGGAARGASTLTQQYVKVTRENAALDRGDTKGAEKAKEVSAARKLQELKYAVQVEKQMTKDQILTNYLNLVYYGDQAYGVEAAARHYFRTTAAKLTIPQAATLAGTVQSPGTNDPVHNPKGSLARRNVVLEAMHKYGDITDKQYADAKASPLGVVKSDPPKSTCDASPYPFWCNYTMNYLKTLPALGATPGEREGRVRRGGYRIITTLDPDLQRSAAEAMSRTITGQDYDVAEGPRYGGAAVTVETGTGKIRAMVQSTAYNRSGKPTTGQTQVNWAADYRYGGSGGFSVGSNMKLFSVVEALKKGLGTSYVITGIRPEHTKWWPREFQAGCTVGDGGWPVKNAEGDSSGPSMSLRQATANSVNTAFVALAHRVGTCDIRETALAMGMHTATGRDHTATDGRPLPMAAPSIILGVDASPATMAQMYATIANKGVTCPNLPLESVADAEGHAVDLHLPGCRRALDLDIAEQTADILSSVMTSGTGRPVQIDRPSIGKTGTDEDNETWFTGATPQFATSVWVGTPDDNRRNWTYPTLHDADGAAHTTRAQAFRIPGPVWRRIMLAAHHGLPRLPIDTGRTRDDRDGR